MKINMLISLTRVLRLGAQIFAAFFILLGTCFAYTPPIGIPDPGMWGSTHPIDSAAPGWPVGWPSEEVENYYYVDNSLSCTNIDNPYGYPDQPRCAIPLTLTAGAYVEIHGGPYTGSQLIVTANGTDTSPVWIRGADANSMPIMTQETIIKGSYVFVEYLEYQRDRMCFGFRAHNESTFHHGVLRNCKFRGNNVAVGYTNVIGVWGQPAYNFNNIVIYNNDIGNFGDISPTAPEQDFHGIKPMSYCNDVWILNNKGYSLSGDTVQVGDASIPLEKWPHHIYIGKNSGWNNKEDGIDIKQSSHVIMSENVFHDMMGAGIVIHNNGTDMWAIANRVYNGKTGIVTTGSIRTYFVGNIIYNIKHIAGLDWTPNAYATGKALHMRGSTDTWAINNTIWDCDLGITAVSPLTGAGLHLFNNIVAGRTEAEGFEIIYPYSDIANNSDVDNNLFYGLSGEQDFRMQWAGTTYSTLAEFQDSTMKCQSCVSADPLFINSPSANFSIKELSPAKNAGTAHDVYNLFQATYGIDIKKDIVGVVRPYDVSWDIGAYEENSVSSPIGQQEDAIVAPYGVGVSRN